ncbi:hypothetical protein F4782DRAFT_520224 [Xylaria castorea]|nr:hypothetical protein F4782DRAFT_520224 [Xylaria castorea]
MHLMDGTIKQLLKGLGVRIDAKPGSLSDGIQLNWSRVKSSLNTRKRNNILGGLRCLNGELRRVVEKAELPEEVESSKIQELKLCFSPQRCSSTHKCLTSLRRAPDETKVYKVAISYKGNTQTSQHWKKLHVAADVAPELTLPHPNLPAPVSQLRTPSPTSFIKSKIARFALSLGSRTLLPSPTPSRSISVVESVPSSAIITSRTEITNLCDAMCTENTHQDLTGYFKDPEKDLDENDHQRFTLDFKQPDLFQITEAFQLNGIRSLGNLRTRKQNPIRSLSAKQRYGIAVSIAWSVLHLGDTPWLSESWSEKQANLFLEKNLNGGGPDSPKFYLSYLFSTSPLLQERSSSQLDELIPNKAIFSLGIMLVELFIMDFRSAMAIGGYCCTAMWRLDDVRRIAGSAYGDAAERCIKFFFPGYDHDKNFNVMQFRRNFYDHVVAPVQAAYYLMPG